MEEIKRFETRWDMNKRIVAITAVTCCMLWGGDVFPVGGGVESAALVRDFRSDRQGGPPAGFTFSVTGGGRPGRWVVLFEKQLTIGAQEKKKGSAVAGQPPGFSWWPLPELNWGHEDFESSALPSELKGHLAEP